MGIIDFQYLMDYSKQERYFPCFPAPNYGSFHRAPFADPSTSHFSCSGLIENEIIAARLSGRNYFSGKWEFARLSFAAAVVEKTMRHYVKLSSKFRSSGTVTWRWGWRLRRQALMEYSSGIKLKWRSRLQEQNNRGGNFGELIVSAKNRSEIHYLENIHGGVGFARNADQIFGINTKIVWIGRLDLLC